MIKKEEIIQQFINDLKKKMNNFFNSKTTYEGKYILNDEVRKGSIYEKLAVCPDIRLHSATEIPLDDIMIGGITTMNVGLVVSVAALSTINKHDGKLNMWSTEEFTINRTISLSYNHNTSKIEITNMAGE